MNFIVIRHIDVASVGRDLSIQTEVFIRSGIGNLRELYMGTKIERLVSFTNRLNCPRNKKNAIITLPSVEFGDEQIPYYLYLFSTCLLSTSMGYGTMV